MSKFTENYKTPDEAEIRNLVQAMLGGSVFLSIQVPSDQMDMIPSIFMPIGLGAIGQMFDTPDEISAFHPVLYEYLDQAGPRSVNGYPIFMSFKVIKASDYNDLVLPKYRAALEVINPELLKEAEDGNQEHAGLDRTGQEDNSKAE